MHRILYRLQIISNKNVNFGLILRVYHINLRNSGSNNWVEGKRTIGRMRCVSILNKLNTRFKSKILWKTGRKWRDRKNLNKGRNNNCLLKSYYYRTEQ